MNVLKKLEIINNTRMDIFNHIGIADSNFFDDWDIVDYTKYEWIDRSDIFIWAESLNKTTYKNEDYYCWEESRFLKSKFIIRKDDYVYVFVHARQHRDTMYDDASFVAIFDIKKEKDPNLL